MKHLELNHSNSKGILNKGRPYTLCLGAGICFGIMPNWEELTFKVLCEILNPKMTFDEFKSIQKNLGWSLDSLLQAGLNQVIERGGKIDEFNDLLQKELYNSILLKAESYGLDEPLRKFISNPFYRNSSDVLPLIEFFEKEYANTSLYKICEFLLEAHKKGNPPKAILTFNADVLIHTLLTLMQLKETFLNEGNTNNAEFIYKALHHVIESDGHKIPIYHIHGSIVPISDSRDARQNLIFPETTYHQISGSTHSWQQIIFQYYALRSKMIFIGLSMSDSNLRRWLSHCSTVLDNDVFNLRGKYEKVLSHIWMNPKSSTPEESEIKKLGLFHLGIKVGQIENWSEINSALNNLIE